MTDGEPDGRGRRTVTTGVLPDGTELHLRPIEPGDAERLVRFHARLSSDTTYYRYFSPHPILSPNEVERFTNVDHVDRDALVALDGDEIVGVGRYDRELDADEAEVAFVVEDRFQGRGVGSLLLRELIALGRERGFAARVAQTLVPNRRMLTVFRHAGLPIVERFEDGVINVRLTL